MGNFLEFFVADLVQKNCYKNRKKVAQNNEGKIVKDRVLSELEQFSGVDQELEVVQANELTSEDAVAVVLLDKCYPNSRKGHVAEQKEKQHCRCTHQQKHPRPVNLLQEGLVVFYFFHNRLRHNIHSLTLFV